MNEDVALLKEVAKLMDLVDVTLCSCIYRCCQIHKNKLFKDMKGTEFIDFMNLKLEAERVIMVGGENQRIYYMIYLVSQHIKPQFSDHWVKAMLDICNIDEDKYKKHRLDVIQQGASKNNKQFAKDIENAIERAKYINEST